MLDAAVTFRDALVPGAVLTMASHSPLGWAIRRFLGRGFRKLAAQTPGPLPMKLCPNHTAIVVEHEGALWIGEAKFPRAGLTSVGQYVRWLNSGFLKDLIVSAPADALTMKKAAFCWMRAVRGTWYDFGAIPRLALKTALVDLGLPMGAEWAWYCTEGVWQAYSLAGQDIYGKRYPTPLTDLKRVVEGKWRLVWRLT